MASKAAQKRLSKEYMNMQKSPPPFVWAAPDEKNILTWNFLIRGPPDTPFYGGEYHGLIMFPPEYPFKPPGIKMMTPSGRFQPDKKICFSMSDYHPGTWNPAWSVATICTGLLSFMLSDEMTTGSMTSTDGDKRVLAQRSHEWNRKQRRFIEAFPDYAGDSMKDLPNMGERDRGVPADTPKVATASAVPISTSSLAAVPVAAGASPRPGDKPIGAVAKPLKTPPAATRGWISGWTNALLDRWHYLALFAVAVVVSRMSG